MGKRRSRFDRLDVSMRVRRANKDARRPYRPFDIGDVIPRPVRKRRSSLRSGRAPIPMTFDIFKPPARRASRRCRATPTSRCSDTRCSGTDCLRANAARPPRSGLDGAGELDRAHQHAGRAEAALQAVILVKRELHRMQRAGLAKALDGGDARAIDRDRKQRAAFHRAVVHVHDAGAALAGIAADMRAGQASVSRNRSHNSVAGSTSS